MSMGHPPIALRARKRCLRQQGWLIPLWLCLCRAGSCLGQVYNLSLAVDEGLPAETLVGDISAGLPPGEAHPGGFFLSEGGGESEVLADFHVHTDTGIIRTSRPLDRERRARYTFVAATLLGEMVQVEITVADVNDHAPRFPRASVRVSISELSPPGSVFRLPAARDPDAGGFGIQGYSLVAGGEGADREGGPLFQLRYGIPPDALDLALLRRLDRERADAHRLLVEAWDGGKPRRSGRLRVEIQVLDENDNAPAFEQSEYRARVREDAPAGSPVCRLRATDPDLGANGEVRYSLSRRQGDPSAALFFEVDERTGLLRLRRPLDREARALHRLAVEARDGGAQPEAATALVAVEVLDVNDNSPAIQLLFLTEAGARVSEGALPGAYVARVAVSDVDAEGEGGVALSLEGAHGAFSLRPSGDGDGGVFFLCLEGPLDRESRDAYELRLVAVDAGSPPLSSQRALLLHVADLNDQAPAFAQPRYRAAVSEAAPPGAVVLRLSASDGDEPGSPNAQVRYGLAPRQARAAALFHLDPLSGVLSVRGGLDHEREAGLELLVLARDLGEPPLSASCLVSVSVEDANDHEPVFERQVYNASMAEHSRAGLCLLQVKATDRDSGHFAHLEYSLYDGFHKYDKSKAFQIDPSTGRICVSQDIDREEDPSTYDLLVKATDGGGLSGQAFLRIEIEDINDNRPIFNPTTYMTSISKHMQPGDEVINVVAADKDSGIFGVVTYELVPDDFSSLFTVDTSTGIIYLVSALSNVEHSSVLLTVSARDGGGLCSVVNAVVMVRILQTAVAPAVFERSHYTFSVPEDIPEGSAVGTVKVREPLNFLETVSYRISSGDPYGQFSIDSQHGIIRTNKWLDHETHCHTVLMVQSQLGSSPVYSNAQVNITVMDVNDNPPVFITESDKINISGNTVAGTALYIAHAEDKDSGLNGAIRYTVVSNQSGIFTIDPVLGVLHLTRTLVADKQKEHTVPIAAEDHGSPPLHSLMILTVIVDEQKEHPTLSFENLVYHVDVKETCSIGAIILQVHARKLDLQYTSGVFVFSLEHNTDSASFRIDPETGSIYLRYTLDYELTQTHSFKAYVTSPVDKSGQTASTLVIVNILDENDNPPVFMHDVYFFEIEESSLPQGVVGTLTATDKDSGRNGELFYFLLSDGKYFKINSNTGEIINWVALDHEEHAQHQLVVVVTDHGSPRHNATVMVYISVTDLNDNRPFFPQLSSGAEFSIKVLEGQPAGTLVATIHAKDLDYGNNGKVLYSLSSGGSLGHFQIDSSSGELRTTEALSYIWRSIYRMVVTAADQGIPSLQRQMDINVEVIPLPKGSSVSVQNIRHFVVPENFRPSHVLGSVRLPGQHLYTHRKQHFSVSEDDSDVPFEIDSSCGDLLLSKELDYETMSHYFFRVVVNDDQNGLPQNNTIFLSIDVEDQNDHAPCFQNNFVVIGIEENVPVGTLVYTFNARDEDGSFLNSNMQYSIHRNNATENTFLIHPFYGSLITSVPLDREMMQSFVLTVVAADQAVNLTDRRQGSLAAKIIILDVNDNPPTFVSSPLSYIREDAEVGSTVHYIVAHDPDQGKNGQITYYLLSSSEDHVFALDKYSGRLATSFALDHEKQESYNLTIVAVDDGTPALSTTQILMIVVLDVNDEPPVFTKALYQASIYENKDPGEVVVKVEATDKDSGTNSLLRYEIFPGPGHEIFQINADTGEITTAISLDRETQDIFSIKVLVRDSGNPVLSSTASVVVGVLDENDHTPKFLLPVSEIQILENQEPSIISTILAVDMDAANNGTVQCQIIDGNVRGFFALNETSGDLSTTSGLDREDVSSMTLVIECSDLGNPQSSSVTHVQITVLDENDNSPLFTRDHYQTSVREDLGEGSPVLELHAVDGDEGPNGEVRYCLVDDTLGAFTINRITGTVTTAKPLDREKKSQYVFRVVATDSGPMGPRSSSITVTVHIEDVNDNSPLFLENPIRASVPFQTSVNQTIATVKASDLDLGLNGAVIFKFKTPETMFHVDPNTGEIFLQEPVPREGFVTYLLIQASDQGVPTRTATAILAISSEKLTETLSFSHNQYEATVPENSEKGTSVFTVAPYDHGLMGKNLKHTLLSEHEDIFSIHPITGVITVEQPEFLDYEVRQKVHFTILADNGLSSVLCGMTVWIQDMNDNVPHFEQSCFTASVWEGQLSNTYIMQIYATDADSGLNGEIEYSILSGNINEAFFIDSAQGIISANTVLNREDISSYRLVLQAADGGTPSLSSTSTVEIEVVDVNDNAPTLRPLGTVELPENAPLGFFVMQVLAVDADIGPPLHYSFAEGGNPGMKFAVDKYTGIITLVQALDFEELAQLELLIRVSDSVHQTTGKLSILIADVNDNPPVFTQDAYQVMIPELTTINASVLTLCAIDRDSEYNGKISYRSILSSGAFSIDPKNGSLFLAKPVTYQDKNPAIQLLVEAIDHGSPPLTAVTSVVIEIQDVNNYAPQFTLAMYNLSVRENTSVGEKLLTFTTIDYDMTHENSYVEYSIIGGNGSNKFNVEMCVSGPQSPDKVVGILLLRSLLDREKGSSYQLLILASDHGMPRLNSTATVSITVLDINDNPPVFTSLEYHVHVREHTPVGSTITAVSASDYDAGSNAEITYSIVSGNDRGHFHLDGKTGSIDLVHPLDYEETVMFSLTVQASDGGEGIKNVAFATVFFSVLDDNDYAPVFVSPNMDCRVHENLPPFSLVCAVSALDFDTGLYGHLSYSIKSSCLSGRGTSVDDMFLIDPLSGAIRTKRVLDFEHQNKYCFVTQARDQSDTTATVTVRVTVEGTDEFDPVFNQDQYFFNFPERNEAGQLVGRVIASDYDRGLDGVVHYSLLKQSPFFSVNQSSGAIYLNKPFHRKSSSMKRKEGTLELLIKAHSPKWDSKFSTCTVLVNISSTLESSSMLPLHTLTISIAAFTVSVLFLTISFAVLIVRYRQKDTVNSSKEKEMPCCSTTDLNVDKENRAPKTAQKSPSPTSNTLPINYIAEWLSSVGIRERKEIGNPCRHSDSSGHGSAEGETAEDEEIQRINEHPCRKGSGSALSDGGSRIPDSGISRDSDQLSCQSGETDVVAVIQSAETIQMFRDRGGGEERDCGIGYTCNNMLSLQNMGIKEMDVMTDIAQEYNFIPGGQNPHYGSLGILVDSDEDLRGSYNWDYLLNWEPRFKPLASVFTDIAELKDERIRMCSFPKEKKSFIFPPPLITSVAQPGLKTVPPQMPTLLPGQAFKKYPHSPLIHHLRYPSSAMTPSFSPSLSLLPVQTPVASPVSLFPSLKGMCPGGPTCELSTEEEIQV